MASPQSERPRVLVLLSGGLDSACCVRFAQSLGADVSTLHLSFGQPAEADELVAAVAVAEHFKVPLERAHLHTERIHGVGLIPGRNAWLVATAVLLAPSHGLVMLGIHAGTAYADCSDAFVASAQRVLDVSADGRIRLVAPFLEWSKARVYEYARNEGVPSSLTYSCERGGPPCRVCSSCRDRENL